MIIIFWLCSNNLTQYQFKRRELLGWETCDVALIRVPNNSLTMAVAFVACSETCIQLTKAWCHMFAVQSLLLFRFSGLTELKVLMPVTNTLGAEWSKAVLCQHLAVSCWWRESFPHNGLDILLRAFLSLFALIWKQSSSKYQHKILETFLSHGFFVTIF